jgi:hypothetical protein
MARASSVLNSLDEKELGAVNGGCGACFGPRSLMCHTTHSAARDDRITSVIELEDGDPLEIMAKEMNRLSLQEREKAYEDLHGVSAMVHETPELIASALKGMEHYLQGIRHKPAYDLAEASRIDYAQDANLRLMFLRADRFDTERAANRLVRWFEWKLDLFGEENLCQTHIGLGQLDANCRFIIETGLLQFLPARDSCGRVVQVLAFRYRYRWSRSAGSSKALLQLCFYYSMIAAEDETNQKNGAVHIIYGLGEEQTPAESFSPDDVEMDETHHILSLSRISLCSPLRWEAVHYLTGNRAMNYAMAVYAKTIGWHIRARLRVHVGSHLECQYGLLSFGVPSTLLPFTMEGELKTNNHKKWVQRRLVKDQEILRRQQSNPEYVFPGVDMPGRNDVLLGSGQPTQDHAGNRRLQELIESYLNEYNRAPKDGGRAEVARKVLLEIKNSSTFGFGGGNLRNRARFLQQSDLRGWWEEVTDEDDLIQNVCNRLRNARRRKTTK